VSDFDWIIKQGDTAPLFEDTLRYGNGKPADLSGATITLILRSLTAAAPITLAGTVAVIGDADLGQIQFAPSSTDTVLAGDYMGVWLVNFATTQMTFPTVGYLSIRIEENLLTPGGEQLVSVPDLKDYMNISGGDRAHDAKLIRFIRAARPIVENITGPIIPTVFDEWHEGGGGFIQLRRTPSTSYATLPVLDLAGPGVTPAGDTVTLGVTEHLGTLIHPLTIVANPALGTTYSCTVDRIGTITRLTGGGGRMSFPPGESVHVIYRAGQSSVPPNVYEGVLELLRVNYQTTMAVGTGRRTVSDDQDSGPSPHFYMPRKVAEMLAPSRRAPAVA
jgi:hypothetical protein